MSCPLPAGGTFICKLTRMSSVEYSARFAPSSWSTQRPASQVSVAALLRGGACVFAFSVRAACVATCHTLVLLQIAAVLKVAWCRVAGCSGPSAKSSRSPALVCSSPSLTAPLARGIRVPGCVEEAFGMLVFAV